MFFFLFSPPPSLTRWSSQALPPPHTHLGWGQLQGTGGGSGETGPGTGSPSQPLTTPQNPPTSPGLREAGVSPPSRGTPGAPPAPRVAPRGGGGGGGAARSLPPGSPRGTPSPARLLQQPSSPQPPAPGLQARVGQGGSSLTPPIQRPGPRREAAAGRYGRDEVCLPPLPDLLPAHLRLPLHHLLLGFLGCCPGEVPAPP